MPCQHGVWGVRCDQCYADHILKIIETERKHMTVKQRHAVYELLAICVAAIFGALALPELLNAHDSIAAVAAIMLLLGFFTWLGWFIYRNSREK